MSRTDGRQVVRRNPVRRHPNRRHVDPPWTGPTWSQLPSPSTELSLPLRVRAVRNAPSVSRRSQGRQPSAIWRATTEGSARNSAMPRRTSVSGGLRCSARSRRSRRRKFFHRARRDDDRVGQHATFGACSHDLRGEDPGSDEPRVRRRHRSDGSRSGRPARCRRPAPRLAGPADRLDSLDRAGGIPGARVVPVDDAKVRVARQTGIVAAAVEVVQLQDRQPGLRREMRLPRAGRTGEQHDPARTSVDPVHAAREVGDTRPPARGHRLEVASRSRSGASSSRSPGRAARGRRSDRVAGPRRMRR